MEKGTAPYPNTLPGFFMSTYYQPYFPYHRESMHQQTIINHSAVIFLTISKLVGVHLESFVYNFFYSFAGKKCPQMCAWIVIHRELIISEHRFHFSHIFVLFYQIVDCIDGKVCRPTRITNQDIISLETLAMFIPNVMQMHVKYSQSISNHGINLICTWPDFMERPSQNMVGRIIRKWRGYQGWLILIIMIVIKGMKGHQTDW